MGLNSKDMLLFYLGIVINLVSAYLFYEGLMNLFMLVIVIIGSLIIIILTGFQLKISEFSERLEKSEFELKKMKEKLKIHEQLINLEAMLITLENKNG